MFVIPPDGKNVLLLLGKMDVISRPTRLRTDKTGKRLIVINSDGNEL